MLQKNKYVGLKKQIAAHPVNQTENPNHYEIDILLKLLPYFEVPLNEKRAETSESKDLRRLLGIAATEADMLQRKKGVTTLIQLIGIYFDKLVSPGFSDQVTKDLKPCFYNSEEKARDFVSVLTRIVWEYNFVNKMFVTHYKILSDINKSELNYKLFPKEVLIFGGTYPLSANQVSAIS